MRCDVLYTDYYCSICPSPVFLAAEEEKEGGTTIHFENL